MTIRLVPEYIVIVLLLGAARAWLFPACRRGHRQRASDGSSRWLSPARSSSFPTAGEVPIIQAMLLFGMAGRWRCR